MAKSTMTTLTRTRAPFGGAEWTDRMSLLKRSFGVLLAVCLVFSLAINAAALAPQIESVTKTSDNQYKIEGSIDGYNPSASGQVYGATYDAGGRMTGVKSITPDANGKWSFTGGKSSDGKDSVKVFAVGGNNNGIAPQGINDSAASVKTMTQLAAALSDNACSNIFIADNITLSTTNSNKTIGINKTVTVSKSVTLTVPTNYILQLSSAAQLTVGGTLAVSSGGSLVNDNMLLIREDGVLTGGGAVTNHNRIRIEGGSVTGGLRLDNNREIQSIDMVDDNGAGSITVKPATISSGVTLNNNNGSGWVYTAAHAATEAALRNALAGYSGQNIEFSGGNSLSAGSFDVPAQITLSVFVPMSLRAGSTVNVYGALNVYSPLSVPAGTVLNIKGGGTCSVQWGGNQSLLNAGAVTVDGALEVGKYNGGPGYLVNSGTMTVSGFLAVMPGSTLENNGTISGAATLVSGVPASGIVTGSHAITTTKKTAAAVSSLSDMTSLMTGPYDVLYIVSGFELTSDVTAGKKLIVSRDAWLRINKGVTMTLNEDAQAYGWVENWGTIKISAGKTLTLGGDFFNNNNGDGSQGAINISGVIDLCPGRLMKTSGDITLSSTGQFRIGGTLCWGSQQTMPAFGVTAGYSKYGDGRIISTYRAAANMSEYNALLADVTCDNIVLGFDMTVTSTTTFTKSVFVPSDNKLTVNTGVTLTVTNGAWLGISGKLINNGTIVVANENGNQGHAAMNSGSVLETANGKIEVYGDFRFNDYSTTEIHGEANITFHYYTNLNDLSQLIYGQISDGYGFKAAAPGDYSGIYADWGNLDGVGQRDVAFILKNMEDRSFLEQSNTGDGKPYIQPYRWLSYGEIKQVLQQLWNGIKHTSLPAGVVLAGKTNSDLIGTYNYGSGSELQQLCGSFMTALGNIEVKTASVFTVNSSDSTQNISYKTFDQAVTVVWDRSSAYSTQNIWFIGCTFVKGITVINSGERFWVNLGGCQFGTVTGKACNIFVQPERAAGVPVFDITDSMCEVFVNLYGAATHAVIKAEQSDAHVSSFVTGDSFTLNGVQYQGASTMGFSGYFEGKYQLDASGSGITESFHAGSYTTTVTASGVDITSFHVWSNIKNTVALALGTTLTSGGYLNVSDDRNDDQFGIVMTGAPGDPTNTNMLYLYLAGSVDISGLTPHNVNINADQNGAIRFAAGGAWIAPSVAGDYSAAAVRVGEGNLAAQGYTITLYKIQRDNNGNDIPTIPAGETIDYDSLGNMTFVHGFPDTNGLVLQVVCGGKAVSWHNLKRVFDSATLTEFASALYNEYGANTAFTYNSTTSDGTHKVTNAADFVKKNSLMADVTGDPVTMNVAVTAFARIADTLGVALKDYFTDNELARVDYNNGISYGGVFEANLLKLASALALGGRMSPYYTWDSNAGKNVLAIWFDGSQAIGRTKYDPNGTTELSALIAAFKTACGGCVYIGDNPNVTGATFSGPMSMTMGSSVWSNVNFESCRFRDITGGSQALSITSNSGAYIRFNNCDFSGAASGFAVNLSTLTAGIFNQNGMTLSGIPSGSVINTAGVNINADCQASGGHINMNGAVVTALDFSNYDGLGHAYDNSSFSAGIWWNDNNGAMAPGLGVGGGTASVNVPADCTTKFTSFSAGGDCPYNVNLSFSPGWTPDPAHWLTFYNDNGHTLSVTGTLTFAGTDTGLQFVELIGTTDLSGVTLLGNDVILASKWQNLNQSHTVGDKNICVYYDPSNDSGRHIAIGAANTTGAIDTATVTYTTAGAEDGVTIDEHNGISLTGNGNINVGDLKNTFGDYSLRLYGLGTNGSGQDEWMPITYTVDASGGDILLIPDVPLTAPYNVLLSVTHTSGETYTFNVAWYLGPLNGSERKVSSASALADALSDPNVNLIHIVSDITLGPVNGQPTTYIFTKHIEIGAGVTLTVADGATLQINNGLTANGILSVAGSVNVFGWLDVIGNWDAHVTQQGGGMVYLYSDFQSFAVDLYNTYGKDYGLSNDAKSDAYAGCYDANYFSNTTPECIKALNFLIENGVIDPSTTGFVGWQKITYSQALGLLGKLADALESALSLGHDVITGYELMGMGSNDLLCNNIDGSPYNKLLDNFRNKVGVISVAGPVTYVPGPSGNLINSGKHYSSDVTVSCADGMYNSIRFDNCTFDGSVTFVGSAGFAFDDIQLVQCQVNGDINIKDNDGKTQVTFKDTTFTTPPVRTVTVTDDGSAQDSARIGIDCDGVALINLPSGVNVVSEKVSTGILLFSEGTATINGVKVTGKPQEPGNANYYIVVSNHWLRPTVGADIPAVVIAGDTAAIDATGDTFSFKTYVLYSGGVHNLHAADTVIVPKAGSQIDLVNTDGALFKVSFDGSMVIDPVIKSAGASGYVIDVPAGGNITYQIDTGSGYASAVLTNGKIVLDSGVDITKVSLKMTCMNGSATTVVTIKELAHDI